MHVTRVLIDAVNCLQTVIDAHLSATEIDFALYHGNSFQIFIGEHLPMETAIAVTDEFVAKHREVLHALNYDDSSGEYPTMKLQLEVVEYLSSGSVEIPMRLVSNLAFTGIPISFE